MPGIALDWSRTAPESQVRLTDLAFSVANGTPSTEHVAVPSLSDPMFNIIESLLGASSATASNKTLAALDLQYGSGITSSNAQQDATSAASVRSYPPAVC